MGEGKEDSQRTLNAKRPLKGQIGAQVKKCHANEISGGLKVRDREKEKQWTLLDTVFCGFFPPPCEALSKVIKSEPHVRWWVTDRWLTAASWRTVKLVLSKRWPSFGQTLWVVVRARDSQGGLRLFLLSPGGAGRGGRKRNLTHQPRCHVQSSPEISQLHNAALIFL